MTFSCRPGLRRFLAQAATMFEMTIYTAGTSQYADAVRYTSYIFLFSHTAFFFLSSSHAVHRKWEGRKVWKARERGGGGGLREVTPSVCPTL